MAGSECQHRRPLVAFFLLRSKELLHSVCLPGSHRARRPLPVEQINREDPLANTGLREDGHLQLLGMRAGDVVVRPFASPRHESRVG